MDPAPKTHFKRAEAAARLGFALSTIDVAAARGIMRPFFRVLPRSAES